MSIPTIVRQIEDSFAYGLDYDILAFMDDMFLVFPDRVIELCEEFKKHHFQKRFSWICQSRPDVVYRQGHTPVRKAKAEKMLMAMQGAGCVRIEYGFESGSQKILDRMNKRTRVEDYFRVVEMTRQAGLSFQANMILGACLFELKQYSQARTAFESAAQDNRSRTNAQSWIDYVNLEEDRERQLQAALRR